MQQKYTPVGIRKQDYSLAMRISDSFFHQFKSRCARTSRYGSLFFLLYWSSSRHESIDQFRYRRIQQMHSRSRIHAKHVDTI